VVLPSVLLLIEDEDRAGEIADAFNPGSGFSVIGEADVSLESEWGPTIVVVGLDRRDRDAPYELIRQIRDAWSRTRIIALGRPAWDDYERATFINRACNASLPAGATAQELRTVATALAPLPEVDPS
jgi:hypothetical protein